MDVNLINVLTCIDWVLFHILFVFVFVFFCSGLSFALCSIAGNVNKNNWVGKERGGNLHFLHHELFECLLICISLFIFPTFFQSILGFWFLPFRLVYEEWGNDSIIGERRIDGNFRFAFWVLLTLFFSI